MQLNGVIYKVMVNLVPYLDVAGALLVTGAIDLGFVQQIIRYWWRKLLYNI